MGGEHLKVKSLPKFHLKYKIFENFLKLSLVFKHKEDVFNQVFCINDLVKM